MMYDEIGQVIGHALNVLVGVVILAAAAIVISALLRELSKSRRFSVRTTLLAAAILPPILGAIYSVVPWTWLLVFMAVVAALVIFANKISKDNCPTA